MRSGQVYPHPTDVDIADDFPPQPGRHGRPDPKQRQQRIITLGVIILVIVVVLAAILNLSIKHNKTVYVNGFDPHSTNPTNLPTPATTTTLHNIVTTTTTRAADPDLTTARTTTKLNAVDPAVSTTPKTPPDVDRATITEGVDPAVSTTSKTPPDVDRLTITEVDNSSAPTSIADSSQSATSPNKPMSEIVDHTTSHELSTTVDYHSATPSMSNEGSPTTGDSAVRNHTDSMGIHTSYSTMAVPEEVVQDGTRQKNSAIPHHDNSTATDNMGNRTPNVKLWH